MLFLYQGIYGVSPQVLSVIFGVNELAITDSFINPRFGGYKSEKILLQITFSLLIVMIVEGHYLYLF